VPEVDNSDSYLSQDLAAAAAKVPEGLLSAASLNAMFKQAFADGHPHLANAKSGIFPSYPPVPVASGTMSDLPSVFHTNFGREITGLASSGLMEQRVLGLGPNGNLITSTIKKLNQSEFFTSLGYTIRSIGVLFVQELLLRIASDSLSSAGASTSGAKKQRIEYDPICRGFNEGKCTYKPCRFRHECQKCGSDKHGANACSRR
jgi:hypothetical protein